MMIPAVFLKETDSLAAIDDAMIISQCQVHHGEHDDLLIHGHRAILNRVQTEDGALGRIDDRCA